MESITPRKQISIHLSPWIIHKTAPSARLLHTAARWRPIRTLCQPDHSRVKVLDAITTAGRATALTQAPPTHRLVSSHHSKADSLFSFNFQPSCCFLKPSWDRLYTIQVENTLVSVKTQMVAAQRSLRTLQVGPSEWCLYIFIRTATNY